MKNIRFLLSLAIISPFVQSAEITLFTSDGCSMFPDGTTTNQSKWANCCIQHDFAYWKGGNYEERLNADKELESCVSKIGEPEVAKIMLMGVRIGGSPYFPAHYRWGYGWPYLRGYQKLTDNEKQEVKNKLKMSIKLLNNFYDELK